MEPTQKKSAGCLKFGLYVVVGLVSVSFIFSLIADPIGPSGTDHAAIHKEAVRQVAVEDRESIVLDSIRQIEISELITKTLKPLKVSKDEFEETAFYYGNSKPYSNTNNLYAYMPYSKGKLPGLRLKLQYAGDDWLFFNKAELKVDERKMEIKGLGSVDRDNSGGKVWEWVDLDISSSNFQSINNLTVMRMVASSKKTTLRLSGDKYRKDRTISPKEKRSIKMVLDAYDKITEAMD